MNKITVNTSYENDVRIVIPKEKIPENIKQDSFFVKLLKKLYIL